MWVLLIMEFAMVSNVSMLDFSVVLLEHPRLGKKNHFFPTVCVHFGFR